MWVAGAPGLGLPEGFGTRLQPLRPVGRLVQHFPSHHYKRVVEWSNHTPGSGSIEVEPRYDTRGHVQKPGWGPREREPRYQHDLERQEPGRQVELLNLGPGQQYQQVEVLNHEPRQQYQQVELLNHEPGQEFYEVKPHYQPELHFKPDSPYKRSQTKPEPFIWPKSKEYEVSVYICSDNSIIIMMLSFLPKK